MDSSRDSVHGLPDYIFDHDSETLSDLSDPPTDLDDMQLSLSLELGLQQVALNTPSLICDSMGSSKRKSDFLSRPEEAASTSDASDTDDYHGSWPKRVKLAHAGKSKFEQVPIETLNQIVSHLATDQDLTNLTQTCTTFANALTPASSAVWRERFLSQYDDAFVTNPNEYAHAYQLRRFVLNQFVPFTTPKDKRLTIQLEVLKDMVLETYLQPRPHLAPPLKSRNLGAFASPDSLWMRTFLSCFFFPKPGRRYGQPHPLFDALQLVLSHLLLSPDSKMAHIVDSSRGNYNLAMVYNWGKPFNTLFRCLPEREREPGPPRRRNMFPNLKSRKSSSSTPETPKARYELDTHALLHIRNFWHRHLIEQQMGVLGENTYARMARDLRSAGSSAKMWDKPLKDGLPDSEIATEWYGHWSCVHPWPKKRQELEEMQSCAEDWESIDPLKLEFSVTTDNQTYGFWSPIFAAIPAFAKTIPEPASCLYIRGLAPFVELPLASFQPPSARSSRSTLTIPRVPKYHPYLGLRLRGIIHSIPSDLLPKEAGVGGSQATGGIPGWSRIAMVLYKPSKRYLIQVLEHAEEEYGGQFGPVVTSQLLQTAQIQQQQQQQGGNNNNNGPADVDPAELDAELEAYLHEKLLTNRDWRDPARMNREVIEDIEERFRLSEYLDWNDIDYAYAYEGVILPGGKIMMGRWWRCGMFGLGDGMELAADGQPVEAVGDGGGAAVGDDVSSPTGNGTDQYHQFSDTDGSGNGGNGNGMANGPANAGNRDQKLERGPFVFWC